MVPGMIQEFWGEKEMRPLCLILPFVGTSSPRIIMSRELWSKQTNRGTIHIISVFPFGTTRLIHNSTTLKGSLGMIWDNSVHTDVFGLPFLHRWIQPPPAFCPSPDTGWCFWGQAWCTGWWRRGRARCWCVRLLCSPAWSSQTIHLFPAAKFTGKAFADLFAQKQVDKASNDTWCVVLQTCLHQGQRFRASGLKYCCCCCCCYKKGTHFTLA